MSRMQQGLTGILSTEESTYDPVFALVCQFSDSLLRVLNKAVIPSSRESTDSERRVLGQYTDWKPLSVFLCRPSRLVGTAWFAAG